MNEITWMITLFVAACICITGPYWMEAIVNNVIASLADAIQSLFER